MIQFGLKLSIAPIQNLIDSAVIEIDNLAARNAIHIYGKLVAKHCLLIGACQT